MPCTPLPFKERTLKITRWPIYCTQAALSETTFSDCDSVPSPRTWRPHDAAYSMHPAVSVPLLFTALCTSTRSDGRYNMDLNKYFLLSGFPRKVVNSVSNIPAPGRRHNSYLKPTESMKTIGNPTQGSQQYHSEPEKSIILTLRWQPFKPRIKSHLLFAGIIRSSPFSPR